MGEGAIRLLAFLKRAGQVMCPTLLGEGGVAGVCDCSFGEIGKGECGALGMGCGLHVSVLASEGVIMVFIIVRGRGYVRGKEGLCKGAM